MNAGIFCCSLCEYKTNKKYNLNRHINGKHKKIFLNNANNDYNNLNNTNINLNNTNIDLNNTNIDLNNTNIDLNNTNIDLNNINIITKCHKCNKKLSSKYYLKEHLNKCKGVINPLECHLCHKLFSFSSSKAVHMKHCKLKNQNNKINELELTIFEPIIDSNMNIIPINNNFTSCEIIPTTTQIINNNNNINININTYNINLIAYNKEDNKIIFDITHITNEIICKIFTRDESDAFKYFCDKLFENKNNQLIVKKNLRDNYSKVHIGFNYWEKILDEFIYPKIMSNIAETMINYIEENKGKVRKTKLDCIIYYLDVMASNGYSNKYTNEYKRKYKNNIDMLKILFNSFL